MQRKPTSRRGYGSGSLTIRVDAAGGETWYGHRHAGGKRIKRRLGTKRARGSRDGLTRAQAEARLRELIGQTTVRATGERLTVAAVARRYLLAAERKRRKRSTVQNIESEVRTHLAPFFADRSMDRIAPEDVADLIASLEAKGLSPKTIYNIVGTLSALFNFARAPRRRWAASNPCDGAELPAIPEAAENRFLTIGVARPPHRARPPRHLPGARPGALSDRGDDRAPARRAGRAPLAGCRLDGKSRIRVRQNYVRGRYGSPKSRRSTRSVPMTDEVGGELDRLFKESRHAGDDDLVFAHPATGGTMTKANITRRLHKALETAALDETHVFHDLRHTFGTSMAAAGVPMRTLQEWMGHKHISTTQRYADYAPSGQEADLVARAFARPKTQGTVPGTVLSEPERSEST